MNDWTFLDSTTASAFGWSVIHFIWQGALIGLVAFIILEGMRTRAARWRYATACSALALCLVSFLGTFLLLMDGARAPIEPTGFAPIASGALAGDATGSRNLPFPAAAWAARVALILWCLGFTLTSLRFVAQWRGARRLSRTAVTTPEACWSTLFEELKLALRVAPSIRLLQSGLVRTPMVVGWLSPVVLVPAEVFTSLDREQVKLVLMHELNHLRRMDHLVNLVQGIIECLLFFHPIVWWLSNQVRVEREHCCDRLTVENHDQPRVFAEALFTLERLRLARSGADVQTTLHATGGNLMSRITRLLDLESAMPSRNAWRTPLAIALSSMVAAGCLITLDAPAGAASVVLQQEEASSDAFPTAEEMRDQLQSQIERGTLSPDQAMKIERLHERLLMALESGRVDTAQAMQIMEERSAAVYEDAKKDVRGEVRASMSRADYDEAVSKMLRMVKSGEITREQMEQRLNRMKSMMEPDTKFTNADYAAASKRMDELVEMVKSGEITPEQMQQRLSRMRETMGLAPAYTRADYDAAVKKMAAMVKSGEITREQMEQRLARMKAMMSAPEPQFTKADYDEAARKMTAMVKSGEITREQMEQRLARMRAMMSAAPKVTKAAYDEAIRKMTAMVEAGKITREQMEQRLAEMREAMAGASANTRRQIPSPPEGASPREVREWYLRVEQRLAMAVETGRMTEGEKDAMLQKIKDQLRSRSAK